MLMPQPDPPEPEGSPLNLSAHHDGEVSNPK